MEKTKHRKTKKIKKNLKIEKYLKLELTNYIFA